MPGTLLPVGWVIVRSVRKPFCSHQFGGVVIVHSMRDRFARTNHSLPPRGRWHGETVTEGACGINGYRSLYLGHCPSCVGEGVKQVLIVCNALSLTRLCRTRTHRPLCLLRRHLPILWGVTHPEGALVWRSFHSVRDRNACTKTPSRREPSLLLLLPI